MYICYTSIILYNLFLRCTLYFSADFFSFSQGEVQAVTVGLFSSRSSPPWASSPSSFVLFQNKKPSVFGWFCFGRGRRTWSRLPARSALLLRRGLHRRPAPLDTLRVPRLQTILHFCTSKNHPIGWFHVCGRGRRTRLFHRLRPRRPLLCNSTRLRLRS